MVLTAFFDVCEEINEELITQLIITYYSRYHGVKWIDANMIWLPITHVIYKHAWWIFTKVHAVVVNEHNVTSFLWQGNYVT